MPATAQRREAVSSLMAVAGTMSRAMRGFTGPERYLGPALCHDNLAPSLSPLSHPPSLKPYGKPPTTRVENHDSQSANDNHNLFIAQQPFTMPVRLSLHHHLALRTPPSPADTDKNDFNTEPQNIPHETEAGPSPEAEPAHPAMDSTKDGEHDQVRSISSP